MKLFIKKYRSVYKENSSEIRDAIKSVYKQGVRCGREHCSMASAAFIYYMNTGLTVKEGSYKNWDDIDDGDWIMILVEVDKKYPHNIAYNPRTDKVVDLTLDQFDGYDKKIEGIMSKSKYKSYVNSPTWELAFPESVLETMV